MSDKIIPYTRYPYFWSREETSEILRGLLRSAEWKYAKKERESPKSKSFVNLYYLNTPVAFDIEDTSFYDQDMKVSTMYVWQVGVNNTVFMGRTWEEFMGLCDVMREFTDRHHRILVYVHFLDHEFQFIRKLFTWSNIFSRKSRSPIYAIECGGLEFRDSYILTGKSLAKSAEDIRTYPGMHKQVGDLDYTLIRGTKTPLSKKEIGYCMKDVQILNTIIAEKIEDEGGNIGHIPLTNTGYVRRYVRQMCLPKGKKHMEEANAYYRMIHGLMISPAEYEVMKWAFQGGFTHANALWVGEHIMQRVDSDDFTSSYPAVMLSREYPMSKGRQVRPKSQEELDMYLSDYLSMFVIEFKNIRMKDDVYENIISVSKCDIEGTYVVNNGRLVSASDVTTAMTNVDLEMVKKFYDYDCFYIRRMYIYEKGYLPKPIIEAVLELYRAKTELKGIPEKAVEYQLKKGMLNSTYGMMVTSIIKALAVCNEFGEWQPDVQPDIAEALDKYNLDKKRFNFFAWGCFITSWARYNLLSGILEFGADYVYSDTDSIKSVNHEKHKTWIDWYNKDVVDRIDKVLTYYGIDPSKSRPKNKKGSEKQIGVWDWETKDEPYTEFKTLGAKRYMYTQCGNIHITIAGVGKKAGGKYIGSQSHPYDFFTDGMLIPADYSGKLTHTYLDYVQEGVLKDYRGNVMPYKELSSVHLEKAEYRMSLLDEFKDYCDGFRDEYD